MKENWYALYLVAKQGFCIDKAFGAMGIRPKNKRRMINNVYIANKNGRPLKFDFNKRDIEDILYLRKRMSLKDISKIYGCSDCTIARAIKRATKNPDQSVQSSITNNSIRLYHKNRGVQVG